MRSIEEMAAKALGISIEEAEEYTQRMLDEGLLKPKVINGLACLVPTKKLKRMGPMLLKVFPQIEFLARKALAEEDEDV